MNLLAARAILEKDKNHIKDPCFVTLLNQIVAQGQRQELTDIEVKRAVERLVLHGELFDERPNVK